MTSGIPREIVIELAALGGCTAFVETGTYTGKTTRWASTCFEVVHTIERAPDLHRLHGPELSQLRGVTSHLGDSRDVLPGAVKSLGDRKALYWLDGHWSGGSTAGEGDECPLMGELSCLSTRTDDIILIDDARFILSAPPHPHDPEEWPTITDIILALERREQRPFVQVIDDVIFIVPMRTDIRHALIEYGQRRADAVGREQNRALLRRATSVGARLREILARGGGLRESAP